MTEAEAREIVERYEALARNVGALAGFDVGVDFLIEYPVEITGSTLVIRENIEGDRWALRRAEVLLS